MEKISMLNRSLTSLAIFRNILNTDVIVNLKELFKLMEYPNSTTEEKVNEYSKFVSSLYENTFDLSEYIYKFILNDENFYVKDMARQKQLPSFIEKAVKEELTILENLANLTSKEVIDLINYDGFLPVWENKITNLKEKYEEKITSLPVLGYGIYAKYNAFVYKDDKITPVKFPDKQSVSELYGYEREKDLIIKNTLALINGEGASNMLLYGDAGTGKSSSVKAVCNHFIDKGLRLVELKKNQLYKIPNIIDELSGNPLKFVIFIDDLSFTSNDDNFSALKAILEGGVSTLGKNIVIYATSNRRHLVKETMAERQGDELHLNDTLQETMSLAARFGLTITFSKPNRDEYLSIVENLAKEYEIDMETESLFVKAEAHAIRNNGRSPRTAKQFIELLKIGI